MAKLAPSTLERFKARLTSERSLLLSELNAWLRTQSDVDSIHLLGCMPDLSDDELLETLEEVESAQANKFRSRLQAIEASLCQLELGLYGYCADCEKTIEPERLQRDPTTQRCQHCHELHQKKSQKKQRILL